MFRIFLLSVLLLTACAKVERITTSTAITAPTSLNHDAFTQVLQAYVQEDGMVNYKRLKENPSDLKAYLQLLAQTSVENMPQDEQLALWINAYNAYTLKLIIDNYPTESILRITLLPIPGVSSAWDLKSVTVGGKIYTLQHVEHKIIRKMNVPEIHAALVCAAKSCPKLRRTAFSGSAIQAELNQQMLDFLNDNERNFFDEKEMRLSKIFNWYEEDFVAKSGSLKRYLAQFATGNHKEKLQKDEGEIGYKAYNWRLNDVSSMR